MSTEGKRIALEVLDALKAEMGKKAFNQMADSWLAEHDRQQQAARTAAEVARQPATVTMTSSRGSCTCESVPRADGRGATLTNCMCEPRAASEPRVRELIREEPTRVETRQDIDAAIDRGARKLADERFGGNYAAGVCAFGETEEGRRLYQAQWMTPVEPVSAPRQAAEAPTGVFPSEDELRADYMAFTEQCRRTALGQ